MRLRSERLLAIVAALALSLACVTTRDHRSVGRVIDDATLSTTIKTKLIADDGVKGGSVDVDVSRGIVTLVGWVDTDKERMAAAEIARSVEGVREVNNQLRLKSEQPKE